MTEETMPTLFNENEQLAKSVLARFNALPEWYKTKDSEWARRIPNDITVALVKNRTGKIEDAELDLRDIDNQVDFVEFKIEDAASDLDWC
jgi:hypothetical protein